jgi:hypothetical protein
MEQHGIMPKPIFDALQVANLFHLGQRNVRRQDCIVDLTPRMLTLKELKLHALLQAFPRRLPCCQRL